MTFMAVVGWMVITGVMVFASLTWTAVACLTLGYYTIGGARNPLHRKVVVVLLGLLLLSGWWFLVIKHAPFTVTLK
jgi:type IV secretory pathway protease TraF